MSCGFTKGENVDVLYLKINDVLEYNPPYVQSDFMCNPGCTFRPWLNWLWIALYFQPTFYFSMFTVNHRGVPSVITTFQFRFRYWQCDQIGRFLKVRDNKIASKRIPNDWQLFGLFWKTSLLCSNCIGYFLENFWKKLGYFLPPTSVHTAGTFAPPSFLPQHNLSNSIWDQYQFPSKVFVGIYSSATEAKTIKRPLDEFADQLWTCIYLYFSIKLATSGSFSLIISPFVHLYYNLTTKKWTV